jgi:hypothetical protein
MPGADKSGSLRELFGIDGMCLNSLRRFCRITIQATITITTTNATDPTTMMAINPPDRPFDGVVEDGNMSVDVSVAD